jgi:RNA polymerase sigma-70 factor (ECF subfamily)
MDTSSDLALFDRIVARDPLAVGELYDRHSRLLFGLIVSILKDRGEAEEILQETFVAMWTRAETYKQALGSPIAWLVSIARHRAIDRLRANRTRLGAVEDSARPPRPMENPEAHAVRSERQRAIARALDALPAQQRELIEQAYFQGLTHSELADRFGLPLGTVKTRIRTGMLALRQQLEHVMAATQ